MSPNGPFFAIEAKGAIWAFRTRMDAESWLEAIDVKNNEYRFFAANGAELRLTVTGNSHERVVVTDEVLGIFAKELEERLRRYLRGMPAKRRLLTDSALSTASLPDLADELARSAAR